MTIRLNLRSGIVLVAVLAVIGTSIAYAAGLISREVSGAFVVGNVQTTDETILLYSQQDPLTALEEVLIPTEDVDAFGFFVNQPSVPFWAANGGGVPFELTVRGVGVEVIVDDEDDGFQIAHGDWGIIINAETYNGTLRFHPAATRDERARFTPDLPGMGTYEVYAYWVMAPNRATDAPYTIHHVGGATDVRVNQQLDGGQFNLLGTFDFLAGIEGYVELSADADGVVIADAVRFVLVEQALASTITDSAGDWIGAIQEDYLDIVSASVSDQGTNLLFSMDVNGAIPDEPPQAVGFVWHLDLDENGAFNEFPPDINVRVAYDTANGWQGFLDDDVQPPPDLSDFDMVGDTVSLKVPKTSLAIPRASTGRWASPYSAA